MCSTLGEYSVIWDEKRQRARKTYRCEHCDRAITPGTSYIRIGSLYDGSWDTIRIHAECDAVCEFIKQHICEAHGERGTIMIGELNEEITSLEEYVAPRLSQGEADELHSMGIEVEESDEGEDLPSGGNQGVSYRAIAEWLWSIAKDGYPKYERLTR
jgi:hypothetical protein